MAIGIWDPILTPHLKDSPTSSTGAHLSQVEEGCSSTLLTTSNPQQINLQINLQF